LFNPNVPKSLNLMHWVVTSPDVLNCSWRDDKVGKNFNDVVPSYVYDALQY